jgi:alkyldihydroxyacetonephosphate synthase
VSGSVEADIGKAIPKLARSNSPVDQIAYARDLWPRHHLAVRDGRIAEHRPGVVVWPESTQEVAEVVRFCAQEGYPLVPFGAGSGVCAGILPDPRTVILDLKRMSRVRSLDGATPSIEVEAGALGIRLEEDLQARGFTLGHFPSSILCSTVGGWVAARSAGQCSGLYGKIEDMVASLECVVGEGEIVRLHRRVSGPDATPLLIGSEGVLGVVTSASLRLHAAPETRVFGAFSFPTVEAGWEAMREMFQSGLRPAVARLYDVFDSFIAKMGKVRHKKRGEGEARHSSEKTAHGPGLGAKVLRTLLHRAPRTLNKLVDLAPSDLLGGATLILVFEGVEAFGKEDLSRARAIVGKHGARDLGEEPARHWFAHRYSVSYRQAPVFMSGAFSDTMEVAAPWSRLGDLYDAVRDALGRSVFVMAHLSHAYPDGCSIYFTFAGSAPTPAAMEATYDATWRAGLDAAIGAGGTLSHHHGVGRSKAPRLGAELGLGVDVVHALRGVLDPRGVMNPGNLLPRDRPVRRPVTAPPGVPVLDAESMLVHARGEATLAEVEAMLSRSGLTLGLAADAPMEATIDVWIASGARGAPDPWLDPADHLVAGYTARLKSGADLEVRPSPRRAVGPDLFALFLGMEGRVGTIRSALLRAHGSARPRPLETGIERDPELGGTEKAWIDRVAEAASSVV